MVQDYINAENDVLRGIVINARNPKITVLGGLYQAPDYKPPSRLSGPNGVASTGARTIVDGIRVIGTVNKTLYPGANIYVENGVIRNCVADVVSVGPNATVEDCTSNSLPSE